MLIRELTHDDIAFATEILDHKGRADRTFSYQDLIALEPGGCFVAEDGGERLGLVTSIAYGRLGWIANLVVRSDSRKRGCGRALLDRAVACLFDRGARTVGLDATLQAVPFYTRAAFSAAFELLHLKRPALPAPAACGDSLVPIETKDLHAVGTFDWAHFGGCRKKVLKDLLRRSPVTLLAQDQDGLAGYLMARAGDHEWTIGPWVCVRSDEVLLDGALTAIGGEPVRLAVPKANDRALALLRAQGFRVYYREMRMYYGDEEGIGHPQYIYATAGPEKG